MKFRRLSKFFAAIALALTFVVAAGAAGTSEVKAQGYYRNYNRGRRAAIIRHRQRYFWNRQRARSNWRYNNRHYRAPYYRRHFRRW
jgi:hypothetical protein